MNTLYKRVFLSLGSNLGDRAAQLESACRLLNESSTLTIKRQSMVLENRALLYEEQPDFLNQVIEIETELKPEALLDFIKGVEVKLGRQHRFRYGPREIDIDILIFDQLKIKSERLTIPHPGLKDRPYLSQLMSSLGEKELAKGKLQSRAASVESV